MFILMVNDILFRVFKKNSLSYLPTRPLGQDMT